MHGYGSGPKGEYASPETMTAFLSKFTSQELVQISKISVFLKDVDGRVAVQTSERFLYECQSAERHHPSFPPH